GELRHETQVRLDAAGIALSWPLHDTGQDITLNYDVYKHYLSIMRELFANIIRHAGATRVRVDIDCRDGCLLSRIGDDGQRFNGEHPGHEGGHGLFNLQRRLQELGGTLRYDRGDDGNLAELDIPLRAAD
ncbi:sensor histidine kinase, partial [Amnimonas aquatica]